MRNIVREVREIINCLSTICEAIRRKQLSKKKTIDVISAPKNELNALILELCDDDTEKAQEVVDLYNERRQDHEDIIRKVIAVLKKEGLIKNHITIELSGDNRNYHQHDPYELNDKGKTYLKWNEDTIHVSYGIDYDFDAFMEKYIEDTFGEVMIPYSIAHYMFTFLHEFGHYIDSTLAHEENYNRMNQDLKKDIRSIEDWEEAQLAYRKVPCEAFADKWAIDFMYKHFPEEFLTDEDLCLADC